MARVSTYLNFAGSTEEAFLFYEKAFGSKLGPIKRYSDIPTHPDQPPLDVTDRNRVMHVELPILAGHVLMGTDVPSAAGELTRGDHVYINLEPDTRVETERLYNALSDGGKIETPLQEMFWGGYFGCVWDKFGIQWMFNCCSKT